MNKDPHFIEFKKIGDGQVGYISVAEAENQVPFTIARTFWTYFTPETITRGRHAHYNTQQVLVAVAGKIMVTTELGSGIKKSFVLDTPNKGLYIPPHAWHVIEYSHTAVQLVFASTAFDERDYIRDYFEFKKWYGS